MSDATRKIIVAVRQVYGADTIYPVCDTAKVFAAMTGTKTISRENLNRIAALGFDVEIQPQLLSVVKA